MNFNSLEDRAIVIIGGTTGLGLSAARACARAGGRVVVCGRNPESAQQAENLLGTPHRALVGDATSSVTAQAAIQLSVSAFGRFDALYHVAGGSGRQFGDGPLHQVTDEAIEETLRLNLISMIYSNRAAVKEFLNFGIAGSVLNMGSVLAESPSPKHFATHIYTAAKSAIVGFTKSCAAYYANQNIRFNVVTPGLVETPMARRAAENEAIQGFIRHKQPLAGGRMGLPEDLDAAVVFFLSDSSRYVTGQVLAVDGGWSVSEGVSRDE
ncbi:MAG: SDR family oxidoreductase [Bythopirellula sp.]|nr:SDR family oxidoreductase [Bythopirellula sp.]